MNQAEGIIPSQYSQYPEIKALDYSDRELITRYSERFNRYSCEYSFASLFLWDEIYRYKLTFFNNWLVVFDTRYDYILMPMGENISLSGVVGLSGRLKQDGFSGDIANVPPEFIQDNPDLAKHYEIEEIRDLGEYIYSTEKLLTLGGKKLRKKKNHISQFQRNYPDYQIRSLDNTRVRRDCLKMTQDLLAENQLATKSVRQEASVIARGLKHFDRIPLDGVAIYADNSPTARVVCFAVYSRLSPDVYTVHFEKVDYRYTGASQMINRETAKLLKDQCNYINREQDLGIPGLRHAKLSYEPDLIYPFIYLNCKDSAE